MQSWHREALNRTMVRAIGALGAHPSPRYHEEIAGLGGDLPAISEWIGEAPVVGCLDRVTGEALGVRSIFGELATDPEAFRALVAYGVVWLSIAPDGGAEAGEQLQRSHRYLADGLDDRSVAIIGRDRYLARLLNLALCYLQVRVVRMRDASRRNWELIRRLAAHDHGARAHPGASGRPMDPGLCLSAVPESRRLLGPGWSARDWATPEFEQSVRECRGGLARIQVHRALKARWAGHALVDGAIAHASAVGGLRHITPEYAHLLAADDRVAKDTELLEVLAATMLHQLVSSSPEECARNREAAMRLIGPQSESIATAPGLWEHAVTALALAELVSAPDSPSVATDWRVF